MRCRPAAIREALSGRAGRWAWRRLRRHLATCVACRDQYDRGSRALARFEGTPGLPPAGPRAHLEQALFAQLGREARSPAQRIMPWLGVAAATLALVVFAPKSPVGSTPRHVAGATVGFRLFCIQGEDGPRVRATTTSESAAPAHCKRTDQLQITWSATTARHLRLVGVGPGGDVIQYWPRGAEGAPVGPGRDQLLPGSFELAVRHRPGRYRVYGVFTDAPQPWYLGPGGGGSGVLGSGVLGSIWSLTRGELVTAWFDVE